LLLDHPDGQASSALHDISSLQTFADDPAEQFTASFTDIEAPGDRGEHANKAAQMTALGVHQCQARTPEARHLLKHEDEALLLPGCFKDIDGSAEKIPAKGASDGAAQQAWSSFRG
jgi:hypothetical protein